LAVATVVVVVVVVVLAEALGATNGLIAVTNMAMLVPMMEQPRDSEWQCSVSGAWCNLHPWDRQLSALPLRRVFSWCSHLENPPILLTPSTIATELNS
jgi:hypothetical protein